MRHFIIAIHRTKPDVWIELAGRFPMEEECVKDYYIFETMARDLEDAVEYATKRRKEERLKGANTLGSSYEPTDEGEY